jgi:HlyD family secretion protein
MPLRHALALLLLALAPAGLVPISAAAEDAAPPGAAPPAAPAISVVTVAARELSDRIYASGTVAPVEEVAVAPQIEGQRIESLAADLGDRVEAGQVMAVLADDTLILQRSQLEASLAAAEAAVAQAEAQLADVRAAADEAVRARDRAEMLRSEGTVSQAALDQARAAATSALARVRATEQGLAAARAQRELVALQIADVDLRLQRTRITAPVAGVVIARNAQIGAIASAAGQPMFVLVRDGLLELRADLAETDLLRVQPGQSATLRPVGSSEPLTGTVRLVDPTVDAVTRLGRVRIAIDDPARVRAGLFAEAEILVARRTAPAVPVTAVLARPGGGARVLRVNAGGIVEEVPVRTGIRDGAFVEIIEGLAEGDTVVARAGAFVRPGDRINPVPADAALSN